MTTTWALVFLICAKECVVEQVETYKSRAECIAHKPAQHLLNNQQRVLCAPVLKD